MMLFMLLEYGLLRQERGDVVVFNNTSCEHPETYEFVAKCKRLAEQIYNIPFLITEFQTYEDSLRGEWSRLVTYRLANSEPYSAENPHGFRWKGEVFEELLSHLTYLPNQFRRICTTSLKLETTKLFLKDWLANKESIPFLGPRANDSQIDPDRLYERHLENKGATPKTIFLRKKEYVLAQAPNRPQQKYADYTSAFNGFCNDLISPKVYGKKAWFGPGGIEFTSLIGIRGDEPLRVARVNDRNSNRHAYPDYEGEHVYMPLSALKINKEMVKEFWNEQRWDLQLPSEGHLSNCTFCFLKGTNRLQKIYTEMEKTGKPSCQKFFSSEKTPSDIDWWIRIEQKYGRDLVAEKRKIKNMRVSPFIGFFGTSGDFSFEKLKVAMTTKLPLEEYSSQLLPCDCTD